MKKGVIFLVILLIIGAIGFFAAQQSKTESRDLYYCPMHPTYTSDKPGDCPICNMKLVKREMAQVSATKSTSKDKKDMYYCPMHPTYTSDKQGDCPICNMKLVKRENIASPQSVDPKSAESICYLHQCPMVHDGKPCPMLVMANKGEKVTCPLCGTHVVENKAEKKILYWTDPMITGYKSDKPGKSPMGMDLVPVYEEETPGVSAAAAPDGYAPVLLTPQKQQLIGIKTASAEHKKITKTIRAVGTIAHDPELYQAQIEYIQAMEALERAQASNIPEIVDQAQRLLESTRIRLQHMGLSDAMIEEIASRKTAEHSLLVATPGEPVWVYAKVYEYELPLTQIGQKAAIEVPSVLNKKFEGTIRAIDRMIDPVTRTTRIRILIENPDVELKPDMYVNVNINIDFAETLVIPQEAVFDTGIKKIVFIDKGQGIFEPRDVIIGTNADGFLEVKQGLNEGERVVTSGNFLIDSESRLKAALEGMSAPGHPAEHSEDSSVTPSTEAPHAGHQ